MRIRQAQALTSRNTTALLKKTSPIFESLAGGQQEVALRSKQSEAIGVYGRRWAGEVS
jgi:hypothetical protein